MCEANFTVRVECYSGYRGEETPRRFYFGERSVEVAEVIDRWLAPGNRYFKLSSPQGDIYLLRHDNVCDCWELAQFESLAHREWLAERRLFR